MVEYSGDEGRNRPIPLVKNEKFEIRIVALEDNWKVCIYIFLELLVKKIYEFFTDIRQRQGI